MTKLTVDIAIIGAGIAGLTCAKQLQKAGYRVVVLDKSRGVGGRMATRRVQSTRVDHGVRYLEPTGDYLKHLIQQLEKSENPETKLTIWTDQAYEFRNHQLQRVANSYPYYIMRSGMSSVAKYLAEDLEIKFSLRVESLSLTEDKTWQLNFESITQNSTEKPQPLTAKIVIIAIPAPQAVTLLETVPSLVNTEFLDTIRSVEYNPCITVMVGYPAHTHLLPDWKAVNFINHEQLAWVGLDSSKRFNLTQPVFVIQSSAKFAEQFLETTDLTIIGQQLIESVNNTLIPNFKNPEWIQIHRWRYAFCRKPLLTSYLTIPTPLPLICIGDWCGGNNIESALKSGQDAADWLQNSYPNS